VAAGVSRQTAPPGSSGSAALRRRLRDRPPQLV